jgi:3-oxoacyl-[acyl-carrier protein] reductase
MDLGIRGKKAIVCASSRGLGRACALALAEAGVTLVINGRDETALKTTAEDIRRAWDVQVTAVAADVNTPEGRSALLAACPEPDILVNNNSGPAFRDFRALDHGALMDGVRMNMITPIELIQAVIDGDGGREFGRNRQHHLVRREDGPCPNWTCRRRTSRLTAFVAGVARSVAHKNVTINQLLPGYFSTERLRAGFAASAERTGTPADDIAAQWERSVPARRFGDVSEFGQMCAFLCSIHAGYLTGQNILMDGGLFPGAF